MSKWLTLLNKELLEMARNFKWLWVPISFILLGVLDPLTTYYMPQILEAAGGLPEGAVIEIPDPSAAELLVISMGEYETIGVLIIALSLMGAIAGERKSGVAQLILVKPVSYFSYITSKWAGALILFIPSLYLGLFASWYYTGVLFEFVDLGDFLGAATLYALWIAFVATVVIVFSSMSRHPGAAAAVSLAVVIVLNMAGNFFSHWLEWSPAQLYSYASDELTTGALPDNALQSIMVTLVFIIVLLVLAPNILKRKELAE